MINRETHRRVKEALTTSGGYSDKDAIKMIKSMRETSKELHMGEKMMKADKGEKGMHYSKKTDKEMSKKDKGMKKAYGKGYAKKK